MQGVHDLNGNADGGQIGPVPDSAKPSVSTGPTPNGLPVTVAMLVLIALATCAAYWPVMFNFFNGDDYVHLTWLADAIHKPEMVWRNFYTSWLDGTTTKFYRPLISVFMVSDYAIWGVNGLGFRLTNIAFHLSATTFIYFIVLNLQETLLAHNPAGSNQTDSLKSESNQRTMLWPGAAAALFALYPLHPEAVAWITGRVDSVVTAFCTASVFFYIKWRRTNSIAPAILAGAAMILGLLSKEMAITLPAVFLWIEIIYGDNWSSSKVDRDSIVQWAVAAAKRCALNTAPFWIILAAYFVVRYFALGTFVGGYDDSLFFISNMKEFISGWVHALITLVVPINRNLMGSHHLISKVWPITVGAASLLLAVNLVLDSRVRKHVLFQLGWLALCLIPVYKLFSIAPDLQGSRLAYLATVPVCILLTAGMYPCSALRKKLWHKTSQLIVLSAILALSSYLLWTNNLPWRESGLETTKIQNELRSLFSTIDGDPQILFLGLPDQIQGAYTCRNALDGMTKKPQLQRDIRNCLMVNAFEPILPFGFLKESIAENNKQILIYRWDAGQGKFLKVEIAAAQNDSVETWTGERLKQIIELPTQKSKPELTWTSRGPQLTTGSGSGEVELNFGAQPCFNTDYIIVKAHVDQPPSTELGIDLLYSNDMYPDFELRRRAHTSIKPEMKDQTLIFGLRGLPEWSLGGNTRKFRLLIPPSTKVQIDAIEMAPARFVTPKISFANSGYLGTKGYLHIGPDKLEQEVEVDIRSVPNAKTYELEITRANLLFESQNGQSQSKVMWKLLKSNTGKGTSALQYKEFKSPGIYEIRAWALDEHGTICGAASDHIVLSVAPAK